MVQATISIGGNAKWLKSLPAAVTFVDVETTGLYASDRVVSMAAIRLRTAALADGSFDLAYRHFVFDPGRESHPRAEEVHGYSDWVLRHQEPFSARAEELWKLLHDGVLIVAHNASFDSGFISREMAAAGCPPLSRPIYCTMNGYRRKHEGSASLDVVCARIGLQRSGEKHGALEDAWLAMNIYLWLHGCPHRAPLPPSGGPANMQPVPPPPAMPAPRGRVAPPRF